MFIKLIAVLAIAAGCIFNSCANDLKPNNWPWRGVSIGFPSGGVADLERYKSQLPINVVRLNIDPRRYAALKGVNGTHALQQALVWTDTMLDACRRKGVGAIVQINHFPLDPQIHIKMMDPAFWEDETIRQEILMTAQLLTQRYGGRGKELVAYQLISEPLVQQGRRLVAPPQWPELQAGIVKALRKGDSQRWIIVAPGPGGMPSGYKSFLPPNDDRLIWGSHVYVPHAYTHQGIKGRPTGIEYPGWMGSAYWDKEALRRALEPVRKFQEQHPAPVYIGEFSAVRWAPGAEQYITDLVSIFNEFNWGWSYFSATGWHGWNPDYNTKYSDDHPENWKNDAVGEGSLRWNTLKGIFGNQ